jgi:outer membrane lipoprotein-sorting protein
VGGNVRRTQAYFSRDNSLGNLKKNFDIAVSREPGLYVMKMVPRTERFRRKIARMVVKLDATKFLLRSLEVDGKSGVTSVFRIEMTALNTKIPDGTFDVYRPK